MNRFTVQSLLKNPSTLAQVARSSGGGIVVRCVAAILIFVLAALMTNFMGAVEYGIYTFIVAWLNFFVLAGTLGFHRSAIRFVSMYVTLKEWSLLNGFIKQSNRRVFIASTALVVLSLGILYVVREPLDENFGDGFFNSSVIATFLILGLAMLNLQIGLLDGFKKVILSQVPLQVMRPVLISIFILIVVFLTDIPLNAPVTMGLVLIATILVYWFAVIQRTRTEPDEARGHAPEYKSREWLVTSNQLALTSGFDLMLVQVDILMMGLLVNTTEGGIYNVASKLAGLLIIANIAVNAILHPIVADLHAKKDLRELQRILTWASNGVFALGVLGGAILFFGAEFLLSLFGEEYVSASLLLRVFIVGILFNLVTGPGLLVLNMTGYQRDGTVLMAIVAGLNILLNWLLIPMWGGLGAVVATGLSLASYNLAAAIMAWRRLNLNTFALRKP